MSGIGKLFAPDLAELIAEKRWDELRQTVGGFDASDAAEIVADLPRDAAVTLFRILPRETAGAVFAQLPASSQEELLTGLTGGDADYLIRALTPDDQARLLDELPAEVTRRILDAIPPAELQAARDLLGYPHGTAGRVMTPRYVALKPDWTAGQALDHVRRTARSAESVDLLYVLEKGRLTAELSLAALVVADPAARLDSLPTRHLVTVAATMTQGDVVQTFAKYDRPALPVVDGTGQLLGIITADDVLDVAQEQATESMQRLGGTEALDQPYLDVSFRGMLKKRGGWLSVLFFGEMLTATAMGYFQGELEKAVVLAMFVPLIISSGGNSGSQSATLLVRSLALTEVRLRDWWRVLLIELRTGITLGTWLGMLGFVRIVAWQKLGLFDYGEFFVEVGVTVWVSLVGVVLFGSVVGSMLPFLLRKCGFDPATSSAPFVATLVDVSGLVIYFVVASLVLAGKSL